MIGLELSELSTQIVEELGEVSSDEEVQVITDAERVSVAKAVARAARAVGATTTLEVMPRMRVHSNDPPATVAAAMAAADVSVHATTKALSHTDATRAAIDSGTRVLVMRGVTEDMMINGGMNTDYEELRGVTNALRDLLDAASTARITSPQGTDLSVSLDGRPAWAITGYVTEVGFAGLPPGKVSISPVEGSGEGRAVIDYSMDNLGRLDEPIELTFEEGAVTEIEGGSQADELRELIAEADDNAGNLAEFALGTNRDARLIGNLAEDKKRRGTAHIAIGDNSTIGGSVSSEVHLDSLMVYPTVYVDDAVIIDDGRLDVDTVRELVERSHR